MKFCFNYIYLIINEAEKFFFCLLTMCISFIVNCLSWTHYSLEVEVFLTDKVKLLGLQSHMIQTFFPQCAIFKKLKSFVIKAFHFNFPCNFWIFFYVQKSFSTSVNYHYMSNTIETKSYAFIFCLGFRFANSALCCTGLHFI